MGKPQAMRNVVISAQVDRLLYQSEDASFRLYNKVCYLIWNLK